MGRLQPLISQSKNQGSGGGFWQPDSKNQRDPSEFNKTLIPKKILNQMPGRGWTEETVRGVIKTPFTTRSSLNKATGNAATVFYKSDGSYVVVDNGTKNVIQISNINDTGWIPDSQIVNPYLPK